MKLASINGLWNEFRKNNSQAPEKYVAWAFGDTDEMADELARLVRNGTKTATSSLFFMYLLENEKLPYVGEHNIILDGDGHAVAIVETTTVEIIPFYKVSERHAYLEGEGDRSLAYWRKVHQEFFSKELQEIGKEFDPKMLIVCEEFKLVYVKE